MPRKTPEIPSGQNLSTRLRQSRLRLAAINGEIVPEEVRTLPDEGDSSGSDALRFSFGGEYRDLILSVAAEWGVEPIEALKRMLTQAQTFHDLHDKEHVAIVEMVPRESRLGQFVLGDQVRVHALAFEWEQTE